MLMDGETKENNLMDYLKDWYAEQNLLIKIAIFIVAWNVIGLYNKYIYPSDFRLKIPRTFRCILGGLFICDSFSIILLPTQIGNYVLFITYFLGGIFGFLNKLPKELPVWITLVSVSLFLACVLIYVFVGSFVDLLVYLQRRRDNKRARRKPDYPYKGRKKIF